MIGYVRNKKGDFIKYDTMREPVVGHFNPGEPLKKQGVPEEVVYRLKDGEYLFTSIDEEGYESTANIGTKRDFNEWKKCRFSTCA